MEPAQSARWPAGGMVGQRGTRASDRDRDRDAAALGAHLAAGRLAVEEFHERLDQVYAAKTLGELSDLMADLPGCDLSNVAAPRGGRPPLPAQRARAEVQAAARDRPAPWQFWLRVAVGAFVVWLITGGTGGAWVLWIAVPLTIVLLRRWSLGGEQRIGDRHRGPR